MSYEMLEDARLRNSHVHNESDFIFTLGASWVESPLTIKTDDNSQQLGTVIENMLGIHLGLGLHLTRSLQIGATTTYSLFDETSGGSKQGIGDLQLNLKWRFLSMERNALAIMPLISFDIGQGEIIAPTVNGPMKTNILSDQSLGYGAMFIYERLFKDFNFTANLGYKYAKGATFDDINLIHRFYTGFGAYIPLQKSWGLNLEWMRAWSWPLGNSNQNPNEFYVGTSFGLLRNLSGYLGASLGNQVLKFDGNDLRVSGGIKWAPRIWSDARKPIVEVIGEKPQICLRKPVFGNSNFAIIRFPTDVDQIYQMQNLIPMGQKIHERLSDISKIEISGHTSASASQAYNMKLAQKRAKSIYDFLISFGISKELMEMEAYGESKLLSNMYETNNEIDNPMDRRVEIFIHTKNKNTKSCSPNPQEVIKKIQKKNIESNGESYEIK